MTLIDAIRQTVSKRGIAVVESRQFVNELDDLGAFRNEPAPSKKVMRGLLESGFGALVVQYAQKREANWQNAISKSIADFAAKSGYKDELVESIADAILKSTLPACTVPETEARYLPTIENLSPTQNKAGKKPFVWEHKDALWEDKVLETHPETPNSASKSSHTVLWVIVIIALFIGGVSLFNKLIMRNAKKHTSSIVAPPVSDNVLIFSEELPTTLKVFQAFNGIRPTGDLDPATIVKLKTHDK